MGTIHGVDENSRDLGGSALELFFPSFLVVRFLPFSVLLFFFFSDFPSSVDKLRPSTGRIPTCGPYYPLPHSHSSSYQQSRRPAWSERATSPTEQRSPQIPSTTNTNRVSPAALQRYAVASSVTMSPEATLRLATQWTNVCPTACARTEQQRQMGWKKQSKQS